MAESRVIDRLGMSYRYSLKIAYEGTHFLVGRYSLKTDGAG